MKEKEKTKVDVAIVGGGIVGLWCAYHILKKSPDLVVAVFESERFFGEHTTGRNSEVLHSGIYYQHNSLKHLHCIKGNEMWREYVSQNNVPFLNCGKIVVASKGQENALAALNEKAIKNGVVGIKPLSSAEVSFSEKVIEVSEGFFVPSSGVLDVSSAIASLKNNIESMGGIVLANSKVKLSSYYNEKFLLEVNGEEIESSILVNSGGLFSIDFRASLGLTDYSNYYVKGNYLNLKKNIDIDKLVYPIPPADGLGLGVHLTLDTAGRQKFGPDTEIVDGIDYSVKEVALEKMYPAIKSIFKNIQMSDLNLGYAGIRPKVKKDNSLLLDFVFNTDKSHSIKGYYEFLGIESPGLTSAPSLGLMLSELI